MNTVTIELPYPPSVNGYWRSVNSRNILSAKGRAYRGASVASIVRSGHGNTQLNGRLEVSLDLYPPDARKRDVDNYSKGVLDALTHAGVWLDDEQIDRLHILKCPRDKENSRVVVTISEFVLEGGTDG